MSQYVAPSVVPRVGELWRILGEIYLVVEVLPPDPVDSVFGHKCTILDTRGRFFPCPLYFFDIVVCESTVDFQDE